MARRSSIRRSEALPWYGHGALVESLVLLVPLLLAYDLGVVLSPTASGADLLSGALFAMCGRSVPLYLMVHAGAALGAGRPGACLGTGRPGVCSAFRS